MEELTLNMVEPGSEVEIVKIFACLPLRRRLVEMGLMKGAKIKVQRIAPLGDPMEIKIKGYNLTIRKRDAVHIIVSKLD